MVTLSLYARMAKANRDKAAVEAAAKKKEYDAWVAQRKADMPSIVAAFKTQLEEEVQVDGFELFINRSQVNIHFPDGDKMYFICSAINDVIAVDYVTRRASACESMTIISKLKEQIVESIRDLSKEGSDMCHLRMNVHQPDAARIVNKIINVVRPNF